MGKVKKLPRKAGPKDLAKMKSFAQSVVAKNPGISAARLAIIVQRKYKLTILADEQNDSGTDSGNGETENTEAKSDL